MTGTFTDIFKSRPHPGALLFPALLLLIIVSSSLLRLYKIPNYPLWEDEARSILTTANIGKFGIPSFENGEVYTRGIVYHYLLYIPLLIFGKSNLFGLKILGVVFGALTILLVYKMASELGSNLAAILAATFIAFSSYENFFVLSIRFYIAFQFFSLLTLYFIYLGWSRQKNKYKILTVISFAATLLVHELGAVFSIIFFGYLLVLEKKDIVKDPYLYVMGIVCLACLYFTFVFNPTADISAGGQANYDSLPLVMGNNFRHGDKFYFFRLLNKLAFKFGWLLIIGVLLPPKEKKNQFYYYYFALIVMLAVITLICPAPEDRYVFNIYPVFIILLCYSYVAIMRLVYHSSMQLFSNEKASVPRIGRNIITACCCLVLVFATAVAVKGDVRKVFNYRSHRQNLKYAHQLVARDMSKSDILVSTNPDVTWIYIRKPEYFLRQVSWDEKGSFNGSYRPFAFKVNKKRDMIMADTLQDLETLRDSAKRVWIITDIKLKMFTSPVLIDFMQKNFHLIYKQKNCAVYSNRM